MQVPCGASVPVQVELLTDHCAWSGPLLVIDTVPDGTSPELVTVNPCSNDEPTTVDGKVAPDGVIRRRAGLRPVPERLACAVLEPDVAVRNALSAPAL